MLAKLGNANLFFNATLGKYSYSKNDFSRGTIQPILQSEQRLLYFLWN